MSGRIVDGREPKGTMSGKDKKRSRGTYVREHKAELRQVIQKLFYEKKEQLSLGSLFVCLFVFA